MHRKIRWLLCWICFLIGDFISKLPGWLHWYPAYNWFMIKSVNLDPGDLGIWDYSKEAEESHK